MRCPVRGIPCEERRGGSVLTKGALEQLATIDERTAVHSAWERRHDLAEGACPECQGSSYVPGPMYEERLVDECPKCKGTGKAPTSKAA